MGSLLSYSAITTKVRAMQRYLFTEKNYNEFTNLSSVPEAVAYLKKHPGYQDIFRDVDETKLHRGGVERLINISLYEDYQTLYKFATPDQRKFLKVYFMHYEAKLLKTYLRHLFSGGSELRNLQKNDIIIKYSKIPFEKLYYATNLDEFITSLKGTEYYNPLSQLKNLSTAKLFDYEIAIDLYYFTRIWKLLHRLLSRDVEKYIINIYGSKIDMLNMQWIYRAKKYYHMSNSDIYSLIIPIHFKLKKSDLTSMVESTSSEELAQIFKETYYTRVFEEEIAASDVVETIYNKILDRIHRSNAMKKPYSVATLFSYLYFKEKEIDKLTTALECIRYGLDPNQTLRYIIK